MGDKSCFTVLVFVPTPNGWLYENRIFMFYLPAVISAKLLKTDSRMFTLKISLCL